MWSNRYLGPFLKGFFRRPKFWLYINPIMKMYINVQKIYKNFSCKKDLSIFFHFFNTHYPIFVWSIFYAVSCIFIRNLWYGNQFTILCNLCFNIQSSNQELLINSFDNYYKTILNNLNLRSCVLFQIYPEPLSFTNQN